MAKRENFVLLAFVAEKLVGACGRVVVLYRMKNCDPRPDSVPCSLGECVSTDRSFLYANEDERDLATSAPSSSYQTGSTNSGLALSGPPDASSDWRELLLGDFEVSSAMEWGRLVRVLICLQLSAAMELLAEMKAVGSNVLGGTQTASLAQAELRIGELEKELNVT